MCAGLVMRRLCAAATYSVTLPEIEKAYVVADLGSGNPISGCSVPANNSTARRSYQATISGRSVPTSNSQPGIIQTDRRRNLLMARRTARRGPCASHAFLCRYRRPRVPHMNMTTEEFEMCEGGYECAICLEGERAGKQ